MSWQLWTPPASIPCWSLARTKHRIHGVRKLGTSKSWSWVIRGLSLNFKPGVVFWWHTYTILAKRGKCRWWCAIPYWLVTNLPKLTVTRHLFLELEWRSHNGPTTKDIHSANQWPSGELCISSSEIARKLGQSTVLLGHAQDMKNGLRLGESDLGKLMAYLKHLPHRHHHVDGSERFNEASAYRRCQTIICYKVVNSLYESIIPTTSSFSPPQEISKVDVP